MTLVEMLESRKLLSGNGVEEIPRLCEEGQENGQDECQPVCVDDCDQVNEQCETRYLKKAINRLGYGIELAELVLTKETSPELQALAQEIVDANSADIETLQGWLNDWYAVEHEPNITDARQAKLDELATLEGDEFEESVLTVMIRNNRQTIRISREFDCAVHEEAEQFAQGLIDRQREEKSEMRQLLLEIEDRENDSENGEEEGSGDEDCVTDNGNWESCFWDEQKNNKKNKNNGNSGQGNDDCEWQQREFNTCVFGSWR